MLACEHANLAGFEIHAVYLQMSPADVMYNCKTVISYRPDEEDTRHTALLRSFDKRSLLSQ